jgi:predicted nucleic acid-binding protein
MRVVLDASAAVHIVLGGEQAPSLLQAVDDATTVIAPGLFVAEVANALWKYHRAGSLPLNETLERYQEAVGLVDETTSDRELVDEALSEAGRWGHPVYDLLYAVLARRVGGTVLTLDERLVGLLSKMGVPAARPAP